MAVSDVIAKMYDAEPAKVNVPVTASENGFAETVATAIENKCENGGCCCKSSDVDSDVKTGVVAAPSSADTVEGEVTSSAMVKFTMFIRVSSSFGAVQEGLIDQFKEATSKFVKALREGAEHDVPVLDSYLSQANASSVAGLQSSKSFIDSILSEADGGLKSIIAQMSGSSWMSGFNSSGNSSSFPSVSSADIAKLQLQNALETGKSQASSPGKVTYSSGHTLELIKGIADPVKVAANDQSVALVADSDKSTTVTKQPAAGIASRNQILDKFLEYIENFSSGLLNKGSITRAAFSFSYSSTTRSTSGEAKVNEEKPVTTEVSDGTAKDVI